jgi:hypothetical protein
MAVSASRVNEKFPSNEFNKIDNITKRKTPAGRRPARVSSLNARRGELDGVELEA